VQGKTAKKFVFGSDFLTYGAPFYKWCRFTYGAVTDVRYVLFGIEKTRDDAAYKLTPIFLADMDTICGVSVCKMHMKRKHNKNVKYQCNALLLLPLKAL
jgi:hypothetical protein